MAEVGKKWDGGEERAREMIERAKREEEREIQTERVEQISAAH